MNKLINCPSGPAGEYATYAMSFYEGCTEVKCDYCYMDAMAKRFCSYFGIARLKPWLINEENALEVFKKEIRKIIPKLQKHGLFFNFSSDPFLSQAIELNLKAWWICYDNNIPVYILTKQKFPLMELNRVPHNVRIGYSLTGKDDQEKGATATNEERIEFLKSFHNLGYKTYCSIEPIIDFASSFSMIRKTANFCNLYKIGLKSGGTRYDREDVREFIKAVTHLLLPKRTPIYFKDSIIKVAGISRDSLSKWCVTRDFNL